MPLINVSRALKAYGKFCDFLESIYTYARGTLYTICGTRTVVRLIIVCGSNTAAEAGEMSAKWHGPLRHSVQN